jgi:hypothetical protein
VLARIIRRNAVTAGSSFRTNAEHRVTNVSLITPPFLDYRVSLGGITAGIIFENQTLIPCIAPRVKANPPRGNSRRVGDIVRAWISMGN